MDLSVPRSKQFFEIEARGKHFSERIMSGDEYPSIFPSQMEAIVYVVGYCEILHAKLNIKMAVKNMGQIGYCR